MNTHQSGQRMSAVLVGLVVCLGGCLAPASLHSPASRPVPGQFVAHPGPMVAAQLGVHVPPPLPIAHPNVPVASAKPAPPPNAEETAHLLQNVTFGRLLETRLA